MLDDCTYDVATLLHKVSCIMWFIKKHALNDANEKQHGECNKLYASLYEDLEKYIEPLKRELCRSCKE